MNSFPDYFSELWLFYFRRDLPGWFMLAYWACSSKCRTTLVNERLEDHIFLFLRGISFLITELSQLGWSLASSFFRVLFHCILLGRFLKNGPMFLSDTESDSDDNEEAVAPPRSKIPIRQPQSLRRPLSFNGPPPPYSVERDNGPSVISLNSKARRAMQNL